MFYKVCGRRPHRRLACSALETRLAALEEGCGSGRVTFPGSLKDRELLLAWAADQMLPQSHSASKHTPT